MCEICKKSKAKMLVIMEDASDKYAYKNSYRCEECTERAKRSYEKIKIEKL